MQLESVMNLLDNEGWPSEMSAQRLTNYSGFYTPDESERVTIPTCRRLGWVKTPVRE